MTVIYDETRLMLWRSRASRRPRDAEVRFPFVKKGGAAADNSPFPRLRMPRRRRTTCRVRFTANDWWFAFPMAEITPTGSYMLCAMHGRLWCTRAARRTRVVWQMRVRRWRVILEYLPRSICRVDGWFELSNSSNRRSWFSSLLGVRIWKGVDDAVMWISVTSVTLADLPDVDVFVWVLTQVVKGYQGIWQIHGNILRIVWVFYSWCWRLTATEAEGWFWLVLKFDVEDWASSCCICLWERVTCTLSIFSYSLIKLFGESLFKAGLLFSSWRLIARLAWQTGLFWKMQDRWNVFAIFKQVLFSEWIGLGSTPGLHFILVWD